MAFIGREAMRCTALGERMTLNARDALMLVEMAMDAHDLAHENRELGAKHMPRWLRRKQAIDTAKGDEAMRERIEERRQDRARGYVPPSEEA